MLYSELAVLELGVRVRGKGEMGRKRAYFEAKIHIIPQEIETFLLFRHEFIDVEFQGPKSKIEPNP